MNGFRISVLCLAGLAAGFGLWLRSTPAPPVAAAGFESPRASGFRITFGLRVKGHGRNWNGGVRNAAQIRSIGGWHLGAEDSIVPPERWNVTLAMVAGDVAAKAVILDLVSPEEQPVTVFTRQGDFSFVPAEIPYGKTHFIPDFKGDVSVERVPIPQTATGQEFEDDDPAILRTRKGEYWLAWVSYATRKRDGYQYTGADQVMIARGRDGLRWYGTTVLSPAGDHSRVALAEDARGRIWCVYRAQKKLETGNFDLYARYFDGKDWSKEERLTSSPMPDIFHRLVADRRGNMHLVWMGYRPGVNGALPQSDILMREYAADRWGEEINVSQSAVNDWDPAVAVDSTGRAWVAWDSYRPGSDGEATYDLLMRPCTKGVLGPVRTVSATPFAEMRADVAVDGRDRVWVAWEEAGLNWGKDTGYENPKHRIWLRPGGSRIYGTPGQLQKALFRRPRVAVLENDQWKEPKARLEASYPADLQQNLFMSPRLGVDGAGRGVDVRAPPAHRARGAMAASSSIITPPP